MEERLQQLHEQIEQLQAERDAQQQQLQQQHAAAQRLSQQLEEAVAEKEQG
jgi:predicted  nucleic acid-binding Zn-ribbon protein